MEEKLFNHFQSEGKLCGLDKVQIEKFRLACVKAVIENPSLGFGDLCIACRIYLNFIIDFPDIDLGCIKYPLHNC